MFLKLEAVDEEQDAGGVSGTKEQLDDGRSGKGLAGASGHLEQEAVAAVLHRPLQGVNRLELIRAQEAEVVGAAEASPLSLILPSRLISIAGPLGKDDVVAPNELVYQTLRVGLDLAVAGYRLRCWECADDVRVAPFQVPEIVQVTI